MPRLFVIFRTFDRIWTCKTFTRELSPLEMDRSNEPTKFFFHVDELCPTEDSADKECKKCEDNIIAETGVQSGFSDSFYCEPHERLWPQIIYKHGKQEAHNDDQTEKSFPTRVRRFSVPNVDASSKIGKDLSVGENGLNTTVYYVLPSVRCTILLDAHVASCLQSEWSRSKNFRRNLVRRLRYCKAFRCCIPDYERWTDEDMDVWDHYLQVPYLIDVVAVWPKQKIDFAWSEHVLGNLNKHVVLEEGFAWLSTLGGAHSSLGETFVHHAERAGEISVHQLRLAMQIGNESLIARCCVFWSWSLLQRNHFKRSKTCILRTWAFCKNLKGRDKVLENMCKAVWSRLRYRWALTRRKTSTNNLGSCSLERFELRDDSSDSGDDSDRLDSLSTLAPSSEQLSSSSQQITKKGCGRINVYKTGQNVSNSRSILWPNVGVGCDEPSGVGTEQTEDNRFTLTFVEQSCNPLSMVSASASPQESSNPSSNVKPTSPVIKVF